MASTLGRSASCALAALAIAASVPARVSAQAEPAAPFGERWRPPAAPSAAKSVRRPPPPATSPQAALPVGLDQAFYLIRSTLLTLNDANRSGNYSVLRDLAAPSFQGKNTAADLAQVFLDLRTRHFDLFAVALTAPHLSAAPQLDGNGMLRMSGNFPTRPLQINFDLVFQNVGGQWRLFGISVATPQATMVQTASPKPSAAR
jgi:hypothetical protein